MPVPWQLVRADTGAVVVSDLEIADGFWSRFKGLQLRKEFPVGAGLLLVPCSSVHTFFMRFAIDVILLDRTGRVLAVHRSIQPWRIVAPAAGAHATLEVPAGTATLAVGQVVRLEPRSADSRPPAKALWFLLENGQP
jgi:uncharacterized membrane protein (UPF0127 family)